MATNQQTLGSPNQFPLSRFSQCEHCGVQFQPKRSDQKFCSNNCKSAHGYHRKWKDGFQPRLCKNCGKEFLPKRRNQQFCNRKCKNRSLYSRQAQAKPLKRCEQCDAEFQPARSYQRFCSPKCRSRADYQLNGDQARTRSNRYYRDNREQVLVRTKKRRSLNPEREAAKAREWRANNPEKVAGYEAKRRQKRAAEKEILAQAVAQSLPKRGRGKPQAGTTTAQITLAAWLKNRNATKYAMAPDLYPQEAVHNDAYERTKQLFRRHGAAIEKEQKRLKSLSQVEVTRLVEEARSKLQK